MQLLTHEQQVDVLVHQVLLAGHAEQHKHKLADLEGAQREGEVPIRGRRRRVSSTNTNSPIWGHKGKEGRQRKEAGEGEREGRQSHGRPLRLALPLLKAMHTQGCKGAALTWLKLMPTASAVSAGYRNMATTPAICRGRDKQDCSRQHSFMREHTCV